MDHRTTSWHVNYLPSIKLFNITTSLRGTLVRKNSLKGTLIEKNKLRSNNNG